MTQDPDPFLAATQVGHAMNMVAELPPYTADDSLPLVLNAAAFESFFVNVRLLLEFLVKRRDVRSIHRHDYLPDWEPEPSEVVRQMRKYDYPFVCAQVAHLSKTRITLTAGLTVTIPLARLRELAGHVFDEMDHFAVALRAAGSEEFAETFESYVRQARTRATDG